MYKKSTYSDVFKGRIAKMHFAYPIYPMYLGELARKTPSEPPAETSEICLEMGRSRGGARDPKNSACGKGWIPAQERGGRDVRLGAAT